MQTFAATPTLNSLRMIVTRVIRNRIASGGENRLYAVSDFADLRNDGAATRALSRLSEEGVVVRVATGLYLYPLRNKYGLLKPSIDTLAQTLAKKEHARLIPTGAAALNALGLSTQVPMNAVYLTNGTARKFKAGNRTITFKRGPEKYFACRSERFAMLLLAMREIGEKNLDAAQQAHCRQLATSIDREMFEHDVTLAPRWMRRVLQQTTS